MTAESSDGVIASAADGGQMLQVEEIHKGFGQLQVLRGVSLEVGRGQVVCGSGWVQDQGKACRGWDGRPG